MVVALKRHPRNNGHRHEFSVPDHGTVDALPASKARAGALRFQGQ